MQKIRPRPVRAICAAVITAAIGVFLMLVNTTQSVGRVFGMNHSFAYWASHKPFACLGWIFEADKTHLWFAAHHLLYPPHYTALLDFYHRMLLDGIESTAVVSLAVLAAGVFAEYLDRKRIASRAPRRPQTAAFSLTLGTSTGRLLAAGHGAGISAKRTIVLTDDDCSQNIVCFGGIGSGKTTRLITPILAQSFAQSCGLFVFDVKGDFGADFLTLADQAGREVIVIGTRRDGGRPCNVLHGLSPEVSASFLKSAFLLAGNTGGSSAYWIDNATDLARNVLGLLSHFPEFYSLYGLHEYIFSPSFRARLKPRVAQLFLSLMDTRTGDLDAADRLATYAAYYTTVFEPLDTKTCSIILTQLSTVLSPFTLPELRKAFCEQSADNVDLESTLTGAAILVQLPLARYGLGAKTAYTMLKLRFFSVMKDRYIHPEWDQERHVVFICDEYQEVISVAKGAISDLNFWDKARNAKCVGVIAAQGHSSFRAAIGDDTLTKAFLQNFRQNVVFRTEDRATIEHCVFLPGQIEVEREGSSRTKSPRNGGRGVSTGTSKTRAMQNAIDPQAIRNLGPGEALALLSIGGSAYDDVITTKPLYVAKTRSAAIRSGAVA